MKINFKYWEVTKQEVIDIKWNDMFWNKFSLYTDKYGAVYFISMRDYIIISKTIKEKEDTEDLNLFLRNKGVPLEFGSASIKILKSLKIISQKYNNRGPFNVRWTMNGTILIANIYFDNGDEMKTLLT